MFTWFFLCTNNSTGIKVFALVLSTGYLYNWHVYRAKADPLRGPDYMYRLIYNTLLNGTIWNFANVVVFFDAAFTSVRLVRDLHDKRGIYAVGPINTSKPSKGGGSHTWSFQKFNNAATKYLPRGWDRVAFTKLAGGWLQVCMCVHVCVWCAVCVCVCVVGVCVLLVRVLGVCLVCVCVPSMHADVLCVHAHRPAVYCMYVVAGGDMEGQ